MAFCLVGDKVPYKDSKWSKIVLIWSKKILRGLYVIIFLFIFSLTTDP
jgi:hypothetical protein